jgi:hypothetical protein
MAGMKFLEIIQQGMRDAQGQHGNLRPGIPPNLYNMSGDNICAIATYHNNPDLIAGYFMTLAGNTSVTRQEPIQCETSPIAINAYYFDTCTKPLYICYIPATGAHFQAIRQRLIGKNEMISFIRSCWSTQNLVRDTEIDFYDDDLKNIKEADSLDNVNTFQVLVNKPGESPEFRATAIRTVSRVTRPREDTPTQPILHSENSPWLAHIDQVSGNYQESKGELPLAMPIQINKQGIGETWYFVFDSMDDSEGFLKKFPKVLNAYSSKIPNWNDKKSLRPITSGSYYRYTNDDADRDQLYSALSRPKNEDTVIIEVSGGFLKTYMEQNPHSLNTGLKSESSHTSENPSLSIPSQSHRVSQAQEAFFSKPCSGLESLIAKKLKENPSLVSQLGSLKKVLNAGVNLPQVGKNCLLFDTEQELETVIVCLRDFGMRDVRDYEYEHTFGTKVLSLDNILRNAGSYFRYYNSGNPSTVKDTNHQSHQNKYVVELSPDAYALYQAAHVYDQSKALTFT